MNETKPIKRNRQLSSLSRDHHDGLLLSWKINNGVNSGISSDQLCAYIVYFFDTKLNAHFEQEELYLFQLLPSDNFCRVQVETEHEVLRQMVVDFRQNDNPSTSLLRYFAELLNEHIRFEERILFNIIEKECNEIALCAVERILAGQEIRENDWYDQFWLKEK
jgi:hemerythrin-like domain-containing protein